MCSFFFKLFSNGLSGITFQLLRAFIYIWSLYCLTEVEGLFAYSLLPYLFFLSTENSILVWKSNNSTLVLKNSLSRSNSIGFRQVSNFTMERIKSYMHFK